MVKKILLILAFTVFFTGSSFGQERLVTKANEKYENYSFSPAIDIYKRVLDKGFVSADLLQKLGNSYYFNANYEEAGKIYKKLIEEYAKDLPPEYYFRYSQTLRTLGDYENSDAMMTQFASLTSEDSRAEKFEKNYLSDIEKNSGRYIIGPFEYNSKYSEFAPAFYKQGLIFSSDRDTGNLARYRHTWNSKDFLDLYKINVDTASSNKVVKLQKDINTRLHESTSAATKDGNTIYFTRNNIVKGKYVKDDTGVIRLKIFKANISDNGELLSVEDLPFNNNSYSVAHPTLSPDEKTLYFASDMPGTIGESDIFKVTINDDGTYGTPENLGSNINTESRETFPFVSSEEKLYFSSDGHIGLGGLDVFAVKIDNKDYTKRIFNVGKEINSQADDFTYIINEETKKGYFASNRPNGSGADDIYSFVENKPIVFECVQLISGTVRDKISNEVLVGAKIAVINENNEEISSTITDSNGDYELVVDCNKGNFVRAIIEGYVPSEEFLRKSDGKPVIIDFYLDRDTVLAGFGDDLAKLLQLSTIYFDLDKYDIRPDAEIEIQKLIAAMEKYSSLIVKVNAHTDSRARDKYNLRLSENRAKSTVAYMVSKGISPDRLQMEGFGETKLVNKCSNGVECSNEEHQLNRRSEFIILK